MCASTLCNDYVTYAIYCNNRVHLSTSHVQLVTSALQIECGRLAHTVSLLLRDILMLTVTLLHRNLWRVCGDRWRDAIFRGGVLVLTKRRARRVSRQQTRRAPRRRGDGLLVRLDCTSW